MASATPAKLLEVMNCFGELMAKLLIEQHQKHLAELDLTLLQAQVLRVLRRGPMLTGRLAAELGISAPAITQLTDRLIRKQLIERRASADDRRSVQIALSARGKRLVDQFRQRRSDIFSEALKSLDERDQLQAVEALERVLAALAEYERKIAGKHRKTTNKDKETSDR